MLLALFSFLFGCIDGHQTIEYKVISFKCLVESLKGMIYLWAFRLSTQTSLLFSTTVCTVYSPKCSCCAKVNPQTLAASVPRKTLLSSRQNREEKLLRVKFIKFYIHLSSQVTLTLFLVLRKCQELLKLGCMELLGCNTWHKFISDLGFKQTYEPYRVGCCCCFLLEHTMQTLVILNEELPCSTESLSLIAQ